MWGTGSGLGANPYPVGKQNAILAWVDDECPECKVGDVDSNKVADGRWGIEWVAVDCPVEGGLQYMFQGSHNFYMKLQVRNHKIPVKSLEFKSGSTWYIGVRQLDNHFLAPAGFPFPVNPSSSSPLEVKITGINGVSVIDAISQIPTTNQVVLNGLKNVQLGSLSNSQPVAPKPVSPPVEPPKAPVTPPKAPLSPPKAPVTPPTSTSCSGVSAISQSDWWIEIKVPSLSSTVSVLCNSGQTVSCVPQWGKHVCDTKGIQCVGPRKAKVDNNICPLGASARMEDENSSSGLPAGAIAGIVIAAVVLVALLIGAVVYIRRRPQPEERF
jgi:hypothetical protein